MRKVRLQIIEIKVVDEFYEKLYSCVDRQTEDPITKTMKVKVPCTNTSEIKKALKAMRRSKAGGADGLSTDLIKDAGNFLLDKLAVLFTKCLQTCSVLRKML